jgi:MYXO-CTERM domain-containing protein
MNPGGGAEVVVRDTSGSVLDIAYSVASGSWPASFTQLGEVTASDPFGWIRGDGNAEVFGVDGAGDLVHSLRTSGAWSSWTSLGSGLDACAAVTSGADGGVIGSSGGAGSGSTSTAGGSSSGGTASQGGSSGSTAVSGSSSGASSGASEAGPSSNVATADGGTQREEAGGCGCASGGAEGSALWLLGALVLLGQRRRRSAT